MTECRDAAAAGNLSKLKRLHRAGRPWDETTCYEAAINGHLECLRYAYENGCFLPSDEYLSALDWVDDDIDEDFYVRYHEYTPVATAAACGHLQTLRYLMEETNCATEGHPIRFAAINGRIDTLSYLIDRGFTDDSDDIDGGVCDAVVGEEAFRRSTLHSVEEPGQDYVACLQLLRSKGYKWDARELLSRSFADVGVFNETQLYLMGDLIKKAIAIVEHHRMRGARCLLEKLRAADEAMCTTYDETAWKARLTDIMRLVDKHVRGSVPDNEYLTLCNVLKYVFTCRDM